MNIRHMKLGNKYDTNEWPERIRVTQGDSSKVYLPKHNASWSGKPDESTETLKLDKSELWPDELCVTNDAQQLKKYTLDKAPDTSKRTEHGKHKAKGMLHELNRLRLENEQLRTLYRQHLENEQLHKLCDRLIEYINDDRCEGCACKTACREAELDECWQLTDIREMAAELGKVVD